jgi:hypothetical protein
MKNTALNTLDLAFTALEKISEFDYVAFGQNVVEVTATVAAVVTGLVSYVWLALRLWWEDYGQTITVGTIQFTVGVADFGGEVYLAGRKLRPIVNTWVAQSADTLFFLGADFA